MSFLTQSVSRRNKESQEYVQKMGTESKNKKQKKK